MSIEDIIQEIRDFMKIEKVTPYRLFKLAGLDVTASSRIKKPNWNPTAATLAKLQDAIRVYRLGRE